VEFDFQDIQVNKNRKIDLLAREVARGQKLVIYAVALNILVVGVMILAPQIGLPNTTINSLSWASWVVRIPAFVIAIYGVLKIGGGLDWSAVVKFFIFILLLIPVINLFALLAVNTKATSFLKNAGYKVGLVGAYK
jgi:hypothetical protein